MTKKQSPIASIMTANRTLFVIMMIIIMSLLIGMMTVANTAYADSMKVVTIGQDLTPDQREDMLAFFNISQDELSTGEIKEVTVTNSDEHAELDGIFSNSEIGSKTISCAYIQPTSSGGINVATANLTTVTRSMLFNALETAGLKNCNVIASAPYEVSGTGALTGILKAYEATGETLDGNKTKAATEELKDTMSLQDGDPQHDEAIAKTISDVKNDAVSNKGLSDDQIDRSIDNAAKKYNVSLSDEDKATIADIAKNVSSLDYDANQFSNTLDKANQKLAELQEDTQGIKGVLNDIKGFFIEARDFIVNVFSGGTAGNTESESPVDFFGNVNNEIFSLSTSN